MDAKTLGAVIRAVSRIGDDDARVLTAALRQRLAEDSNAVRELVEAGREAANLLSSVESCSLNNFIQLASEVEQQLRAAIAKATGASA